MRKKLGIIGGMGPLSSAYLYRRITELTDVKADQDHIPIVIDSQTQIPDRTAFLQGVGEDPYPYLLASALFLETCHVDAMIIGCNTAHYCYNQLCTIVKTPIISMIDAVVLEIKNHSSFQTNIGVLGTKGLRLFSNYKFKCKQEIMECYETNDQDQSQVNDLIYKIKKDGITDFIVSEFERFIHHLEEMGWNHFILGCTELASLHEYLAQKEKYINSVDVLAKHTIVALGYSLKGATNE
jgi:aspartate racemase